MRRRLLYVVALAACISCTLIPGLASPATLSIVDNTDTVTAEATGFFMFSQSTASNNSEFLTFSGVFFTTSVAGIGPVTRRLGFSEASGGLSDILTFNYGTVACFDILVCAAITGTFASDTTDEFPPNNSGGLLPTLDETSVPVDVTVALLGRGGDPQGLTISVTNDVEVPEAGTLILFGLGLAALSAAMHVRRQKSDLRK